MGSSPALHLAAFDAFQRRGAVLSTTTLRTLCLLVGQLPRKLSAEYPANSSHNHPTSRQIEKHQSLNDALGRQFWVGDKSSFKPEKGQICQLYQDCGGPEPARLSKAPEGGCRKGNSEKCAGNPEILARIALVPNNNQANEPYRKEAEPEEHLLPICQRLSPPFGLKHSSISRTVYCKKNKWMRCASFVSAPPTIQPFLSGKAPFKSRRLPWGDICPCGLGRPHQH